MRRGREATTQSCSVATPQESNISGPMRLSTLLAAFVIAAWAPGLGGQSRQGAPGTVACNPVGNVRFVCGQQAPEDLVVVPGSQWILASSFTGSGGVNLINVRDHTTTLAFPTAAS